MELYFSHPPRPPWRGLLGVLKGLVRIDYTTLDISFELCYNTKKRERSTYDRNHLNPISAVDHSGRPAIRDLSRSDVQLSPNQTKQKRRFEHPQCTICIRQIHLQLHKGSRLTSKGVPILSRILYLQPVFNANTICLIVNHTFGCAYRRISVEYNHHFGIGLSCDQILFFNFSILSAQLITCIQI